MGSQEPPGGFGDSRCEKESYINLSIDIGESNDS